MKKGKHARVDSQPTHNAKKVIFICLAVVIALFAIVGASIGFLLHAGTEELHQNGRDASYAQTLKVADKTYSLNPHVSSILFMGVDKENGRLVPPRNGQADAIMLLVFNEETGKVSCLAISRSSWVPVIERDFKNGLIGQRTDYLCLGYSYGYDDENSSQLICRDVSNLLNGVPINAYYTLNMSGIGALVDAVGGVNLTALSDVAETDIKAGDQLELRGDLARDYVWQRDTADDLSSAERLERQEQFARAFANAALEGCKSNPLKLFELFDVAEEHSVTNLGFPELAYLASFIASHNVTDVDVVALPGEYVLMEDQPIRFEVDEMQLIQMVADIFYIEVN